MENSGKKKEINIHEITPYERGFLDGQNQLWDKVQQELPRIVKEAVAESRGEFEEHDKKINKLEFWMFAAWLAILAGIVQHIMEALKYVKR